MEKKKIIIPVVTIAVIGAVGGTGYYYRDNVIDVATEAFDVVAEKIPFLQSGKSDDKVYVEKVSKIMNTYTGNTNRYNGVVESQDSYEVNVDSSRTIKRLTCRRIMCWQTACRSADSSRCSRQCSPCARSFACLTRSCSRNRSRFRRR